ncbi:hypothetical protein BVRB_9g210200 isoform A [Beta vulgaris subsp. vulgaris]|nr:hypothetical protein BVRB_9g210200 isoform A [Beta vulgaris subsp. vulgaris]
MVRGSRTLMARSIVFIIFTWFENCGNKTRDLASLPVATNFRTVTSMRSRPPRFQFALRIGCKWPNKASIVALNAEIRRNKGRLLEEVPKLPRWRIKGLFLFLF